MTAPTLSPTPPAPPSDLPTVADFLTDAADRLEEVAAWLSGRYGDLDTRAALLALSRATAAQTAAVRAHTPATRHPEASQP